MSVSYRVKHNVLIWSCIILGNGYLPGEINREAIRDCESVLTVKDPEVQLLSVF